MDTPKPSAGHLLLEKLSGSWEGEETMHPSQWDPKGGVAVGRNKHRVSLGGFALLSDYEQERDGTITFTGHGVYTYDPNEDHYTLHWFDCMGSPPEVFVGGFEGDVLTLAHDGPGMHARMTYDLSTPGIMKGMMEMSPDGAEWKVLFEAVYKRT
ncbi:MAG: hypothetical protein AMS18_17755 [Gemmatimonas sp. SG8_17]|nr:MAG: hypothetical protein AMS18_17755 [Gemmatimonas sp. SG8_17]